MIGYLVWARERTIARVPKSQIVSIVDDDASVLAAMQSLVRFLGFIAFVFGHKRP